MRPHRIDRHSDRVRNIQVFVIDHQGHHNGHKDVQHRADQQRPNDANRHVLLRVLSFLARRRNGLKSDIGKEHNRRGTQDAAPTKLALLGTGWRNEGAPIAFQSLEILDDEPAANQDEGNDDCAFDGHNHVVDAGAFRDTYDQQTRQSHTDQKCGQVE